MKEIAIFRASRIAANALAGMIGLASFETSTFRRAIPVRQLTGIAIVRAMIAVTGEPARGQETAHPVVRSKGL